MSLVGPVFAFFCIVMVYDCIWFVNRVSQPFIVFGFSVMDRWYKEDMTLEEAKDLLRKCIHVSRMPILITSFPFCSSTVFFPFSVLDIRNCRSCPLPVKFRYCVFELNAIICCLASVQELRTRFLINMPSWKVKVVDKNGIREVDLGL